MARAEDPPRAAGRRAGRVVKPLVRFWPAFGVVALVLGFVVDFMSVRTMIFGEGVPEVELAYFEREGGTLRLVDPSNIVLNVDPEDVEAQQMSIPLNLAVRNLETSDLRDARITFSYPAGLTVDPEGSPLIDPRGRTLVYEHELRDLAPVDEFTPLDTIDTLHVDFKFHLVSTVTLSRDGVPFYLLTVAGFDGLFEDKVVEIGLRIEVPDRPPITGTWNFLLKAGVQVIGLESSPETTRVPVTADDDEWFTRIPEGARLVDSWTAPYDDRGVRTYFLSYSKYAYRNATYQRISLDGKVRRVIVDQDGDLFVDSDTWDSTGDGLPDTRQEKVGRYMPDWPREAALR